MKAGKFTEEQTIAAPYETGAGARVVDLCHKCGMSEATFNLAVGDPIQAVLDQYVFNLAPFS